MSNRDQLRAELDRSALRYLERFDSSISNLRRVLKRKAPRLSETHSVSLEVVAESIDELIARFQGSGLVDDSRYAGAAVHGLRGRGLAERSIVQRLRAKGIGEEVIEHALRVVDDASEHPELEAARRFVKRRRLGAYRTGEPSSATRRKDLQALARAGFSYEIARQALGVEAHTSDDAF